MNTLRNLTKKTAYTLIKNPLSKKIYRDEIKIRSKLKITDIYNLSKNIPILSPYTPEIHMPNDFYGHAKTLKKFLGMDQNYKFKFLIEHGIFLSTYIGKLESELTLPTVVTASKYRAKILKTHSKKAFSVGPIIHYAENYLSSDYIKQEKKKIGKTLLAFPSHSTLDVEDRYNVLEFCRELRKLGKNYNTIRVCLYWKDILNGLDKKYKRYGFQIVTAGHILDPFFLPRLKTIIELSDFTISNDAGTHVGYCVLLKKPHYIYFQKHKLVGKKSEEDIAWEIRDDKDSLKSYFEVLNIFTKKSNKITGQMKKVVNLYWGIDQIKTKKQMQKIIEESERIYQNV